jgi:hypothetical protein
VPPAPPSLTSLSMAGLLCVQRKKIRPVCIQALGLFVNF